MANTNAEQLPSFIIFCFHPANGWRTWDADTLDDGIGAPCAIAILGCAPGAPSKVFDGKKWVTRPYNQVSALIAGLQQAYPVAKPEENKASISLVNLDEVTGLSPATRENTPDIAGDPELFGEGGS